MIMNDIDRSIKKKLKVLRALCTFTRMPPTRSLSAPSSHDLAKCYAPHTANDHATAFAAIPASARGGQATPRRSMCSAPLLAYHEPADLFAPCEVRVLKNVHVHSTSSLIYLINYVYTRIILLLQ